LGSAGLYGEAWRVRAKLSTDQPFIGKVRDIVGLYLYPRDHAVVLSHDKKSQIGSRGPRWCCRWAPAA
jgi:hypothetical protein